MPSGGTVRRTLLQRKEGRKSIWSFIEENGYHCLTELDKKTGRIRLSIFKFV